MKGLLALALGVLGLASLAPAQGTAKQASERFLTKSVTVHATRAQAWRAWTTPEGFREIFGANAEITLAFGGRYEIQFDPGAPIGKQGSEGCRILSFVPERMLSFTWNSPPTMPTMRNQRTFVVLLFTPEGDGTRIDLKQGGWGAGADWDSAYAYFDDAWGFVLDALKTRFEKGPVPVQVAANGPSTPRDMAALDKISQMIGGVWRGSVQDPKGLLQIEFRYKRHPDGKGVIGEGEIGKGSPQPLHVYTQFGWDPVAKAVYYLDTHDSETVYFGHCIADKDDVIFTFSPVGMLPQVLGSRTHFVGKDTIQAMIRTSDGKEIIGFTLRRSPR